MCYIRTTKKKINCDKGHLALSSAKRMDLKQIERCLNNFLLVKATIHSALPGEMDVVFHGLIESYSGQLQLP